MEKTYGTSAGNHLTFLLPPQTAQGSDPIVDG